MADLLYFLICLLYGLISFNYFSRLVVASVLYVTFIKLLILHYYSCLMLLFYDF